MDSLSQFALGAAIGEATLGAKLGRKAMLVGGFLGTLPDLDVLVHYADAVASFTYHRSWSHSLLVLSLVSPIIAYLLYRSYPKKWLPSPSLTPPFKTWLLCVFLILITHPILDGFTVYGTQLLWPLSTTPIAWGSIFIIDPLYTLPLIIGLVIAYRSRAKARNAAMVGLLLSTLYLGVTLLSQQHARVTAIDSLAKAELGTENVLVAPSPFSLLWRIVSMDGDNYHEGFYSLLDSDRQIDFATYESNRALIDQHADHWPIARMDWFTNSMISASIEADQFIINDLRMGVEASYVFRFLVGEWNDPEFKALQSVQMPMQFDTERMRSIVKRTWDERVNVEP